MKEKTPGGDENETGTPFTCIWKSCALPTLIHNEDAVEEIVYDPPAGRVWSHNSGPLAESESATQHG